MRTHFRVLPLFDLLPRRWNATYHLRIQLWTLSHPSRLLPPQVRLPMYDAVLPMYDAVLNGYGETQRTRLASAFRRMIAEILL